jgi:hypothetical protein
MSGRTQYADLIREAGRRILAANLQLETGQLPVAPMTAELAAYRDLFHALGQHGLRLLGGEMGRRRIRASVVVEQSDIAGMQLTDHLMHVGQRSFAERDDDGVVASWQCAADVVRAASDLLATHRDASGEVRAPEGDVLNQAAVRAAGFGELASLAIPVATAADGLSRRLLEAGLKEREVDHLVPRTASLREACLASRHHAQLGGIGRPLAELHVARPAVRYENPVLELQDRVARLHRVAHQLTREDRVGVCTMADLAVAGVVLNETAAGVLRGTTPLAELPDLAHRREIGRFKEGAAAWRELHAHLRILRTTTPAIAGVRGDVLAIRELAKGLGQGEPTWDVQAALVGGARRFADVAVWNLRTLEGQAKCGRLLIQGKHLTGNQVSDDPNLVRAKLKGLLVPVLDEHVEELRSAFGRVAMVTSGESSTWATSPDPTPLMLQR